VLIVGGGRFLRHIGKHFRSICTQDPQIATAQIDRSQARLGLVEHVQLEEQLSTLMGRPVEFSTRKALPPLMRPEIERGATKLF
jgi:hypothetical protein